MTTDKVVNINWDPIIVWLQKQGITIVILIALAIMFNMRVMALEKQVQSLNQQLIECEKSKIELYRNKNTSEK